MGNNGENKTKNKTKSKNKSKNKSVNDASCSEKEMIEVETFVENKESERLNKYIENYVKHDKTKSAIMLTAPWGTGKSYYIKNSLRHYLKKSEIDCYIVSLYGLESIFEINKSLYMEARITKIIEPVGELSTIATVGAKTLFKGVASFKGIDVSLKNSDLQKIYKSIDLKGKLIIFEDLERSGVDIIEFLGYVNNFVEQDGVKVLIVANEDEIRRVEEQENGENDQDSIKKIKQYDRIKEKTVSETLKFEGDTNEAIKNIIAIYKDELSEYSNEEDIKKIKQIFDEAGQKNLRTFLYACQKTSDMFKAMNKDTNEYDEEFKKMVFYLIFTIVLKLRNGEKPIWKPENNRSYILISSDASLFNFCHDYIIDHFGFEDKMYKVNMEFVDSRMYNNRYIKNDTDLNVVKGFYVCSEYDIIEAVGNIKLRLKKDFVNPESIPIYEYANLARYLVRITQYVNINIDNCIESIIENLKYKEHNINKDSLFGTLEIYDEFEKKEEWHKIKQEMIKALDSHKKDFSDFDYEPENISEFRKNVFNEEDMIVSEGIFLEKLDIDKLVEMLFKSTPKQIDEIRTTFFKIYRTRDIDTYFAEDKPYIEQLIDLLSKEVDNRNDIDAIQRMQINFFIKNLSGFLVNEYNDNAE